jgi:hypothetical protein
MTNEVKTTQYCISQTKFSCFGSGRYGCGQGKNLSISILRKDSHTWVWSVNFFDLFVEGEAESLWQSKDQCYSTLCTLMMNKLNSISEEMER